MHLPISCHLLASMKKPKTIYKNPITSPPFNKPFTNLSPLLLTKSLNPKLTNLPETNRLLMEGKPISSLFSSELIAFLILEFALSFFTRLHKLSTRILPIFFHSPKSHSVQSAQKRDLTEARRREQEIIISREDAEMVMEKMGLIRDIGDGKKLMDFMGADQMASLFEEMEPSLVEVKEAFNVFDENGDGFVEAGELQRVLRKLGFVGEVGLDFCMEMICVHDKDGDGKIDFDEFVKLMESCFC